MRQKMNKRQAKKRRKKQIEDGLNVATYAACEKCKYNYEGECDFYDMGSGNEIDMPCYREKELIKEAVNNLRQVFLGAESEEEK